MAKAQQPVRKAVLPVAGLGTRLLPATKVVPKELAFIVDKPAIQFVVEECVASGIEEVILVTAPGKEAIAAHFAPAPDIEGVLARKGRSGDLAAVQRLASLVRVTKAWQQEPRGLGHAVLCARAAVGNEPFAVLLPDDLIEGASPALGQLIAMYDGAGVVALEEVPAGQEHLYGIASTKPLGERRVAIETLVEKPAPGTAPSRLAVVGRYVLPPAIFDVLTETPPGRAGEIQLTDALAVLARQGHLVGCLFEGRRFDAGDRVGYVLATLHFALASADLAPSVRAGIMRELGLTETPPA